MSALLQTLLSATSVEELESCEQACARVLSSYEQIDQWRDRPLRMIAHDLGGESF